MEKMQKLKIWLDKEEVNRIFIRRIGIPQYRLVDAVEVEDLQDIMNEYLSRESDRKVFGLDYDKENEKKSKWDWWQKKQFV